MARKKDESAPEPVTSECSPSFGQPLTAHLTAQDAVTKLAEVGITDAEQLLAVAAIDDVREFLLEQLGVGKPELDAILKDARKAVPEAVAIQVGAPDPYEYGLGALPPTEEVVAAAEAFAPAAETFAAVALPASANLISRMPAIRNQGARGTCVAFTLSAVHDYATRLPGNLPNNFSEQHLYYETKRIDGAAGACGTWQARAAVALANRGQCFEAVWPYNPSSACNSHGPVPAAARPRSGTGSSSPA